MRVREVVPDGHMVLLSTTEIKRNTKKRKSSVWAAEGIRKMTTKK